jgi:hypothetical protein
MTGRHRRETKFRILSPEMREAMARNHRRPGKHRASGSKVLRAAGSPSMFVLGAVAAAGITGAASSPSDTAVIGDVSGATDNTITTVRFLDAKTAYIQGCGNGDRGMMEQNTMVLEGFTPDGRTVRPDVDPVSEVVRRTPTGLWNCASGTIVAPKGAELSGISGVQPYEGQVSSWRVGNPLTGLRFGVPPVTHSGPGVPPVLQTAAQARQVQQAALGMTPRSGR